MSLPDIRRFAQSDAAQAAALLRAVIPYEPMTEARLLQYHACKPARISEQWWVAEQDGQLLGWASAGLHLWTGARRVGALFVGVAPEARRTGLGRRLYDTATAHLETLAAERLEGAAYGSAVDAAGFLERRGFKPVRRAVLWALNPATAAPFEIDEALERLQGEGIGLASLRDLADRPEALHRLYSDTLRDVPAEDEFGAVPFEDFVCYRLRDPMLDLDGSLVVIANGEPVAYAWITLDPKRRLGFNAMTGTLPAFRGRGLAKLAKAASLRWAATHGVDVLYTSNDQTNAAMLALNRTLGYTDIGVWEVFSRRTP